MNCKEIIERAVSEAYDKYPFSSDEEFFRKVRERADKMDNKNNIETLEEVHVPNVPAPGRKRIALRAAAGTAAALAVIGGSVWGIGYLNEHGGLKGPDVQGAGAGYHEDTSSDVWGNTPMFQTESDRNPKENVFDFADAKAVIHCYKFDGKDLYIRYNVIFDGEPNTDFGSGNVTHKILPQGKFTGSTDVEMLAQHDNTVEVLVHSTMQDKCDTISFTMLDNDEYVSMKEGKIEEMSPDASREITISLDGEKSKVVYYLNSSLYYDSLVHKIEKVTLYPQMIDLTFKNVTDTDALDKMPKISVDGNSESGAFSVYADKYDLIADGDTVTAFFAANMPSVDLTNTISVTIGDSTIVITDEAPPSDDGEAPVPEAVTPTRTGYYEGEAALAILKQYAGEDYCYPLEDTITDNVHYTTHDVWTGDDTSKDYRFDITAAEGDTIFAVTGGKVIEVNVDYLPSNEHPDGVDEGIYVVIQAADGRKWQYSHLHDHYVNVGDTVKAGDRIAAVGATGRTTGPHVCISFPDSEVIDPDKEKSTSIVISYPASDVSGDFEFLYYIDGELQKDMTETREISDTDEFRWDISGSGVHTYKVLVRCPTNRLYETLVDTTVDLDGELPGEGFTFTFDKEVLKTLAEHPQGDLSLIEGIYAPGESPFEYGEPNETETASNASKLPEFPIAISNGNGLYGEYLDPPITGDEAWALVKERGGIDFDYDLPYDRSLFTFTGAAFVIDYADCDVTALVGGNVEFAGFYMGWGQMVLIHDENGHYWLYGHLGEVNVSQGDKVEAGAKIGHTGSSGYTTHQLFAMRVG